MKVVVLGTRGPSTRSINQEAGNQSKVALSSGESRRQSASARRSCFQVLPICFGPFSLARNSAIAIAGSVTMFTVPREPKSSDK